jgi:hypothetical protein
MYRFGELSEAAAMPRTNRPPAYRLHKARNLAVVTINGKNHYLGKYDSPESHEGYGRLIAEWKRNGRQLLPLSPSAETAQDHPLLIEELVLLFFRFVQGYYVKHGQPTSEQDNIRQALRFVRRLYGSTPATDFRTKALKNVRQAMADAGRCRKLINKDVHRVRGMFRWAVEEELLPVEVHRRLIQVKGLRKGRSSAKETEPVAGRRGAPRRGRAAALAGGGGDGPAAAHKWRPATGDHRARTLRDCRRGRRLAPA